MAGKKGAAKAKSDLMFVSVSGAQVAMLEEALGLIDHYSPHFRKSALAFAKAAGLHEAERMLIKLEEARESQRKTADLFEGERAAV